MNNLLVRYKIITNRGGVIPFDPSVAQLNAGNYVSVFWDDVASDFVIHKFDNSSDTTGTVMPAGPDLGARRYDYEAVTFANPIPYSFCDGANLQTFTAKTIFPYATKVSTPNHFSCATSVCDLQISDNPTVQPATDFVTADGAIEVSATSSNGIIRYSLDPNFIYSSEGQSSGLFAGLLHGTYTITAKDELGCIDQITVAVPVPDDYNVLYRADYKDVNGIPSRVDILQRGFSGSLTEVDAGPDPFVLKVGGEAEQNKFEAIWPSDAIITLWSPTNFYFRDLFTQDDRKYQVRWYKNHGNTLPGFTPAALDDLENWTNIDDDLTNWTTGAAPSVNGNSNRLRIAYTFEEGRMYSFGYTFERSDIATDWLLIISIVNGSDGLASFLAQKYITFQDVESTASGTFSFIPPTGAAGIAVKAFKRNSGGGTITIGAFTNETPTESAGDAGYELKWLGYIVPNNYSEPYIKHPYPVQITATDGLADLKNFDFLDKDGNKYREDLITIDAISEILLKTDLGINIQTVINRFEVDMDQTASDDPLAQCKFNPETFYHNNDTRNCLDALEEILKSFGGKIKQRLGKWFIYHPEELVSEASYREFDADGVLITNGTVDDIVDIDTSTMADRAVMEGGSQVLEVVPAYGRLYFKHTLLKNASLIKSYSFEPDDLYTDANGLKLFSNWNVNIANTPGAVYGIKETKAFEGDYNFYLKYPGSYIADTTGFGEVVVTARPITIEYESNDAFEFRFSYASLLASGATGTLPWVKLKWSLKIGSYYFNETTGEWTTDSQQKYNEIIIDRFNETLEKKVTALFRTVGSLTEETAIAEFVLTSNSTYDFANTAALKDSPTTTRPIGSKVKVNVSSTIVHYYVLQEGTDLESLPDVVRPDDYATTTNERIWVSEDSRTIRGRHVDYNYLDNVVLLHFPGGAEPPNDITIERVNNPAIKVNFEEEYLLNDIDTENINNSERTYKNFFKRLDGTPTQEWERTYRPGTGKLLELLSNDIVSQYKTPSNKITGSFLIDREVLPSSILNEVNDGNRKYEFMGYELNDKHGIISFDIVELKDTVTDDESEEVDAGFTTGFSLGFRS